MHWNPSCTGLTTGLQISPGKDEHKWPETNETVSLLTSSKAEADDTLASHSNQYKMPSTPPPPSPLCKVKNLTACLFNKWKKTQEDKSMQGCTINATWYRRLQGFLALHSKRKRGQGEEEGGIGSPHFLPLPPASTQILLRCRILPRCTNSWDSDAIEAQLSLICDGRTWALVVPPCLCIEVFFFGGKFVL